MNTLFLSEMNADRDDTVFHMQCAASVAAPPKALTKAQKNRAAMDAFNAGRTVPKTTTRNSKSTDNEDEEDVGLSKSAVVKPTVVDDDDDVEPKRVRTTSGRSKSMIDRGAASMETMYLAEMTPTQADDVLLLQCAGSVAAPKKALTKAQKNRAAIEAYNVKVAARKASK